MRWLTALPVYNEAPTLSSVVEEVVRHSEDVLVVDDGSTDATPEILAARPDVRVIRHERNRGYGAALRSAFRFALDHGYDGIVTVDCDGQHEPRRIPQFQRACQDREADIVSGSRYLRAFPGDTPPPADRRRINARLTDELNRQLGLRLTDAFCGFKAYRTTALARMDLVEDGYAMPLELWVQAVARGLRIIELPVPLIYLDAERSFGGALDDPETRLRHYFDVLHAALRRAGFRPPCCEGRAP